MSRIVSAVGVPVLADECTAKQIKVSYAMVLVEVDITREFVKDIKVRDNTRREFTQKEIPEWRPFFCSICNKTGHECKETTDAQPRQTKKNKEGGKRMWIPTGIAKAMQGINNLDDLRAKMASDLVQVQNNSDVEQQLPDEGYSQKEKGETDRQQQTPTAQPPDNSKDPMNSRMNPEEGDEGGWTKVSSKKSARRPLQEQDTRVILHDIIQQGSEVLKGHDEVQTATSTATERDGSPLIPSTQ